jgi:hypothetical protein
MPDVTYFVTLPFLCADDAWSLATRSNASIRTPR